jgi:di/tricarboxylate transporter
VVHYSIDNVVHEKVADGSDLIGQPRIGLDLTGYPGVSVITVVDGSGRPISAGTLEPGDRITLLGDVDVALQFALDHGLDVDDVRSQDDLAEGLISPDGGAAEVVIPPRSGLVGRTVQPGQVVNGGLVILAVSRDDRPVGPEPVELRGGDTLLVEGPWSLLDEVEGHKDVLVVDSPELVRRQAVPLGPRSATALGILGVMVLLLTTGVIPAVVTAMLAAGAMILLRVLTMEKAYRGISWTTLLLVAGMIPMSTAITNSGAGDLIATAVVDSVGSFGPTALLAGLFVITVVFSQLISNTATALVMIPIAVAAADQLDISARPVLMSLCVGAAVAFLTPVATPVNMMIMRPAGYRFGDYWRLGLPLALLFGLVAILWVPVVWSF